MTGSSREKFSVFLRTLASGTNQDHPNPKTVKFTKSNLFPERGTVFDYCFQKSGAWAQWEDSINKMATIPSNAKVIVRGGMGLEYCIARNFQGLKCSQMEGTM